MDSPDGKARVRVFVDFWNFQLTLNEIRNDDKSKIDWRSLGPWLAKKACEAVSVAEFSFDGMIVYTSYDPKTDDGKKFNGWARNFLDRQPGVSVECLERKAKSLQKCPRCHKQISTCPHCKELIKATVEKGVDTLIATDMIRLAWEEAYDLAVLVSLDGDLVPAVEFLNMKGRKVIQAGFPPKGAALARACWASFNVGKDSGEILRA